MRKPQPLLGVFFVLIRDAQRLLCAHGERRRRGVDAYARWGGVFDGVRESVVKIELAVEAKMKNEE